jgi:hypothetical protein
VQAAYADDFAASTVQSPLNPVTFGQVVSYTTTVTNTSGETFPQRPEFEDEEFLSMFVSRYRSDAPAPNTYISVTGSQGTCTNKDTTPPSVDCTLGTLAPGASATYTSTVQAQVSIENRIAVLFCTSVNDCGTVALADADTIVKTQCVVPRVAGRLLASAKHLLRKASCGVGKVTRKAASRRKRGRVLGQKPAAGTRLDEGAKVALVVGKRRR